MKQEAVKQTFQTFDLDKIVEVGAAVISLLDASELDEESKHKVLTLVKAALEPLGQPITVRWNGRKETPGKVGYV